MVPLENTVLECPIVACGAVKSYAHSCSSRKTFALAALTFPDVSGSIESKVINKVINGQAKVVIRSVR